MSAILTSYYGWQHILTQRGWFFTKAALVTFSGAAFIALFRFKTGIVTVIGACAAIGLAYSLLL